MKTYIQTRWKTFLVLFIIVFIGSFLRLYDLNWDQGFHLHPDERFLTIVGTTEQLPHTFFDYFNPTHSTLNPSVVGFPFFVYGTFPLSLTVLLSILLHVHTYDLFIIPARTLSALFDIGTLLMVYKTAKLLTKTYNYSSFFPFLATFFYAIAVLPIQLAHFYTVDTFANFFGFASFYFSLSFVSERKSRFLFLSSALLGLAIASKVSTLLFLPLNMLLLFAALRQFEKWKIKTDFDLLLRFFVALVQYLLVLYVVTRIADPYIFAGANFFIPKINRNFLNSLYILYNEYSPHTVFPPAFQWINKVPISFALQNIILYGLGIPYTLIAFVGIIVLFVQKKLISFLILFWTTTALLLEGIQFAQTMRYFIFFYPFFALFAGIGTTYAYQKFGKVALFMALIVSCVWPMFFFSIYTKPHTRVVASDWMNNHIPNNSIILTEYWDDVLPLNADTYHNYKIISLPVFDPDSPTKWNTMTRDLQKGDYLVLSSNRGWATLSTLAKKFPQTSTWYQQLFSNKLSYKMIAEFNSYPSLSYLGIPLTINDTTAEEAFTVYDHPTVFIFKHR